MILGRDRPISEFRYMNTVRDKLYYEITILDLKEYERYTLNNGNR